MKILQRTYQEEKGDFHRLWKFLIKYYGQKGDSQWSLGRLGDWKYGIWHEKKQDPDFLSKNCQLFTNAFDEILGVAIAEEGDSLFHMFAFENYEAYLYPKMLDFVEKNWMKKDGLRTEISEDDILLNELLLKKEYTKTPSSITVVHDLTNFKRSGYVPDGFKVINFEEYTDPEGKMMLYLDGFEGRFEASSWDHTIHNYNRQNPAYNPRYDFSVVNEEGVQVSGCVCFINFENNYAEIEKVCTREAYRKKGLAFSVIQYAMEELKSIGIEKAVITGYSEGAKKTYQKAGPMKIITNYEYKMICSS